MPPRRSFLSRNSQGFGVFELLVALGAAGLIFVGLMQIYRLTVSLSRDHQIRIATQVEAQALLQTIGAELRVLGNGVPFDQANFQIGESTLSDPSVTRPIVIGTAAADNITFRLNETGDVFLLTQDFDPSSTTTLFLTDTSSLDATFYNPG